ncbi:MAG TPA: carboxylating nicotinate-nucleotide diphosphorylase [Methanosarcinaceae archaeon]|nr:carboxylating nicotinate-nucleotide diphosphorylase [Methanosarcinaceae archaeon]
MFITEIERFIDEDLGYNDISCTVAPDEFAGVTATATIFTKENCTLAGLDVAKAFFDYFNIHVQTEYLNGDDICAGDVIFTLSGSTVSILRAERLVLNFLGHLIGIATLTRSCVRKVEPLSHVRIACTRKTTPGIRKFEKMAVIAGGGDAHRFNLSDSIMLKDNHIKLMGIEAAIKAAKNMASFTQKIEVEVESTGDAILAAKMGVDIIMLDNMEPGEVIRTVETLKREGLRDSIIIEASGGIDQDNVEEYAKTGIDVISMGSLIHKANWIDVSLEFSMSND